MDKQPKRITHDLKFRLLTVKSVADITPNIRRVTLTGDDLKDFVTSAPEDHVKVFFPKPGTHEIPLPTVIEGKPIVPEGSIMRDYTPRRYDSSSNELDLEFVLHKKGPASVWAANATPGQKLGIGGPRGSFIYPEFDWYLLIGDESALPSFARRLEELPAGKKVLALLEIEAENQKYPFHTETNLETTWLPRNGRSKGDFEAFEAALKKLSFPQGEPLIIVSGEMSVTKIIKSTLLKSYNFKEENIKATGYWK